MPHDRWSQAGFVHAQKSHPGTAYTFSSGSVGDVSRFDAAFFGISPREAAQIDPQQRVLLELSWQAFEDAGLKPSSMRGSACGVYIGIASADYSYRLAEDLASIDSAVATGNTASIAANRLSYFFDLRGPSMAIDTACSSSLVAFHQACQAIRAGEITHALTGGISLHLHPYGFIIFSKASMLSPMGNCNVFDEAGDGYVRSEGGGIFVLKDYDLAVADGDRILAVVAQTAVNTDGKKAGLTIPKPEAQAELLSSVYKAAGITPDEISYIEAHGTGTAVGDPIETLALGSSLGQQRNEAQPLPIGSVKSNLGHLEAASGVAGLVKALFVVEQRKIPPTIGIRTLNPRIDFNGLNLEVVTQTRVLPDDKPVIVGVNSFGFGGANAHVILRSPEVVDQASASLQKNTARFDSVQDAANAQTHIPFVLSAATPLALQAAAERLSQALTDHATSGEVRPDYLYEVAYQLAFRREAFEHRAVVFASKATPLSHDGVTHHSALATLSQQLAAYAAGADNSGVLDGVSVVPSIMAHGAAVYAQGPAFFYSGNGTQWLGMGRKLLTDPIFKKALAEIDQTFVGLAGFSLTAQLQGLLPELTYENTDIAQPALFAVQVGVTKMLAAMGVKPRAVAGHSVGEVAAAWAAGILDLKAAVQVIYHRSRLQQTTKGRGNMSAVAVGVDTATRWLAEEGLSDTVVIAGINSFCGLTLAGTARTLTAFEARLTQERAGFKRLELDYAFHSPVMDVIQVELEQALSHLIPTAGEIPFYSAVTGALLCGTTLDAEYWWKNIRQPVLFESAAQQVLQAGHEVLVEIGPHPVLRGYLNDCVKQRADHAKQSQLVQQVSQTNATTRPGLVLPSLSRQQDDLEAVRALVARTWIAGAELDLSVLFSVVGLPVVLPSYPWQREHHWHSVSAESPNTLNRFLEHPLLGYRLPQHELLWENQLDPYRQPFLADHVVGDAVVFPGTGYVELALAAAQAWHVEGIKQLEDLEILSPLTFNSSHGKVLRVGIEAADGRVSIQTRDLLSEQGWTLNARARIILEARFPVKPQEKLPLQNERQLQSLEQLSLRHPDFDAASHQRLTRLVGLQYGEAFQALKHGWLGKTSAANGTDNECVTALFEIPKSLLDSLDSFHLHPALLDCSFQLIIQLLCDKFDLSEGIAFVPTQLKRISLQPGLGAPHHVKAQLLRKLTHSLLAEFTLFDAEGRAIARLEGARFRRVRLQKAAASGVASRHDLKDGAGVNTGVIQHIHTRYIPLPLQPGMHPSTVSYQRMLEAANDAARRSVLDRNYRTYVDELDPLLDTLCNTFAVEALAKLGLSEDADYNNTLLQKLAQQSPETAPLLQHLLQLAIEEGRSTEDIQGIRFFQTDLDLQGQPITDKIDALNIWNTLLADYPDYFAIVHTVGKVGQHLPQLVAGEQSLAEVLGQTSGVAALTNELVGNAAKARLLDAVKGVLKEARQQLAPADRLGFLEVAALEPALACELGLHEDASHCDVIFACPELSTLATRHQLVEDFPGLRLAGFAEPAEADSQQASGREYRVDLAIVWLQFDTAALNSLALDYALTHLKPGGTLLVAGQHRTRWLDFTFGARADWWVLNAAQKNLSMQRDRSVWESQLAILGLENIHHMDTTQEVAAGAFLLIAHNPLSAATQTHRHEWPRSWLLVADDADQPLRDAICTGLQDQGDIVSVFNQTVASDETNTIAQHLKAMRAEFGELDGIIHVKGLGAAYQASMPSSGVDRCISAANLLKACQLTNTQAPVWFITQGAHTQSAHTQGARTQSTTRQKTATLTDITLSADVMLSGFIRTLGNEVNTNRVQQIDLNATAIDQDLVEALIDELALGSDETEVVLTTKNGRFVPRLTLGHPLASTEDLEVGAEHHTVGAEHHTLQLNFSQPGQLRNLQWQSVKRPALGADEVEIKVEATGLNFRDVMYALGLLSDEAIENGFAGATIGLECSGEISRLGKNVTQFSVGERVVGFGPACFAERVITQAAAVSRIPRALSSEAAATIPSAFLTSYYALVHLGRLEPGEKILIHGGAGGVGLAAIQIARCYGAEIFATAGSDEKRELLRMMGVDHVLDSRSLGFAEDIMTLTQGAGIDVVLNSLAGEVINRNLSILKPFGRFLELGKRDFYENTRIGLRPFRNNITYFAIDADQLMNERPGLTAKLFGEVMGLFEKGTLHALPYTRFEARDVVEAFRFMQQSQQIGKIVVTYRNGIPAGSARAVVLSSPMRKDTASFKLDPHATYLVTGGLGGFGLRSALWLAEKGAQQLILLGRRGPDTAEAREGLEALATMGVKVSAHACDITDAAALSEILRPSLPQLKGVIHAAAVIEDSLIENLSPEQFERVLSPKLTGALNLHRVTQPLALDFFVLYSSATTLFGNPGQAAYVASNCGLEALAAQRRAQGLAATCMLWGALDDTGFLARHTQVKDALQHRMGGRALSSAQALAQLEHALVHNHNNGGVLELDFSALAKFLPTAQAPRFGELARFGANREQTEQKTENIPRLLDELDDLALAVVFMAMVKQELSQILRLASDKIQTSQSIYDMGLDSLMGVELVVSLEARFGVRLSVMSISEHPSVEKLTHLLLGILRAQTSRADDSKHTLAPSLPQATAANSYATQVAELVKLHGSDSSAEEIVALADSLHSETHQAGRFLQ